MSKIDKPYVEFLSELKSKISQSRYRAVRAVNQELILLYWEIGKSILEKQSVEKWGSKVLERLSVDLSGDFPEMKGFSVRNLKYMRFFAETWSEKPIGQQPVAQLPWGHNIVLMTKLVNNNDRLWYAGQSVEQGWSRNVLVHQIESNLKKRIQSDDKVHNFDLTISKEKMDLALNALKDPYIFDFLSLGEDAHEREIEKALINHVQKFLLELGAGFAFVGRQYHLEVGDTDFYMDLLFYHTKLHCYVVIELKATEFKPEYTGKLNFYLSVVNDRIKTAEDHPTIGILLCKTKNKVTAEYALKDISKPMGITEYKLGDSIPEKIQTSLPTIEELEFELQKEV